MNYTLAGHRQITSTSALTDTHMQKFKVSGQSAEERRRLRYIPRQCGL